MGGSSLLATLRCPLPYPSSARSACSSPPSSSWEAPSWECPSWQSPSCLSVCLLGVFCFCACSPGTSLCACSFPPSSEDWPEEEQAASAHHRQCHQHQHQISQTHPITSRCLHQTSYSERAYTSKITRRYQLDQTPVTSLTARDLSNHGHDARHARITLPDDHIKVRNPGCKGQDWRTSIPILARHPHQP